MAPPPRAFAPGPVVAALGVVKSDLHVFREGKRPLGSDALGQSAREFVQSVRPESPLGAARGTLLWALMASERIRSYHDFLSG